MYCSITGVGRATGSGAAAGAASLAALSLWRSGSGGRLRAASMARDASRWRRWIHGPAAAKPTAAIAALRRGRRAYAADPERNRTSALGVAAPGRDIGPNASLAIPRKLVMLTLSSSGYHLKQA